MFFYEVPKSQLFQYNFSLFTEPHIMMLNVWVFLPTFILEESPWHFALPDLPLPKLCGVFWIFILLRYKKTVANFHFQSTNRLTVKSPVDPSSLCLCVSINNWHALQKNRTKPKESPLQMSKWAQTAAVSELSVSPAPLRAVWKDVLIALLWLPPYPHSFTLW